MIFSAKFWLWQQQSWKKTVVFFGTKLFQIFACLFVQTVWNFLTMFDCCWNILLSKAWDEWTVWVGILFSEADYFSFLPGLWTNIFCKKLRPYIVGRSFQNGKPAAFLQLAQNFNILTKIWHFFIDPPSHFTRLCQKRLRITSLFKGVNNELIDSFTNQGTKYLFIFHFSCAEICNSKVFVGIASEGTHWGLTTIYI